MTLARFTVDLTWTGASGSPGVNVWHMRSGEDFDLDFDELSVIVRDFYTAISDLYPSTVTIKFAGELTGVGPDTGDIFTADPWTVTGGDATEFLPPASAVFVNWRADTGGRSGRGRTYLSPFSIYTLEDNGTPGESTRTLVLDSANDLIESSDSAVNGALVIWSRTEGIARDITSAAVPNMFASLRSRRD